MEDEKLSLRWKLGATLFALMMTLFTVNQFVHNIVLASIGGVVVIAYVLGGLILTVVNVASGRRPKKLLLGPAGAIVAAFILGMSRVSPYWLTSLAGVFILGMGVATIFLYVVRASQDEEFRSELSHYPGVFLPIVMLVIVAVAAVLGAVHASDLPFALTIYYGAAGASAVAISGLMLVLELRRKHARVEVSHQITAGLEREADEAQRSRREH